MKTIILALYPYQATHQEAWLDFGSGMTYTAAKPLADFLDLKTLHSDSELKERLTGYDLVAFGLKSSYYPIADKVINIAKEVGAKVLVAGIHTAAAPRELVNDKRIDYIFYGESEITFPQFLLNPDNFGREIKGQIPQDLDGLPFMDRSVFKSGLESSIMPGAKNMVTVIAARGCPYFCSFCQPVEEKHFGKKLRRRSVDNLLTELEHLKREYNPESVMIHDDTFLLQPKWLEEFIVKYPKIGLPFWASARADGIVKHPDLVKRLVGIGWRLVSVGFESGSQRILDILNKGTTPQMNIEASKIVKEAGGLLYGNYMAGIPSETKKEVMQTVEMAKEINADVPSWAFFSPYPGNALGEKCIKEGLSLLDKSKYNRFPMGEKIKGVDYEFLHQAIGK